MTNIEMSVEFVDNLTRIEMIIRATRRTRVSPATISVELHDQDAALACNWQTCSLYVDWSAVLWVDVLPRTVMLLMMFRSVSLPLGAACTPNYK